MPCPCPCTPAPWAIAVAAGLVGLAEQVLLNPITVLRSRAFAGRKRNVKALVSSWRRWSCGLPLLSSVQLMRGAVGFGLQAYLASLGMNAAIAGLLAGATDGFAFTPARRLCLAQHLGARQPVRHLAEVIIRTEGWRGLWKGCRANTVRTAWGGAAFFGCLWAMHSLSPSMHPAIAGALATAGCTIAVNPMEVHLARLYTNKRKRMAPRVAWRGIGPSLLRSVPAKALSYWAIRALAARLAA